MRPASRARGREYCGEGHGGFAAAHVALNQPGHWRGRGHIGDNRADYAQLCAGRFKCPLVYILFKGGFIHVDHCAALAARAHGAERQLVYD